MVYTSHCCYRGQRKHVPAAGIVKKQGHRFLLIFWWTPGKDFPNSPCQTGDPRQVTEPEMELSSMPALSGITIKAQSCIKALPQLGMS